VGRGLNFKSLKNRNSPKTDAEQQKS